MSGVAHYLLVLYLAERHGSAPTAPGAVASALDRSPAAATEMLQRLDDRGLLTHEPYEGATLTPAGRETAEDLHETYATLSRFFRDVLDLPNHETEALVLAGAVSPAVAERLESTLPLASNAGTPPEASPPAFLEFDDP